MAAFMLQQQSYLVATETTWLEKPKIFAIRPFVEEKKNVASWSKQYLILNSMILEEIM